MHGGLDKGFVFLAVQDVFLEIEMCCQSLTHDTHGQLAERKMRVIGRQTLAVTS